MTGHIDYICDPTVAGNWRFRLNLNHMLGCMTHAPWSARPLPSTAGHPNRSYHLVAPSNFFFTPVPPPLGPIVAEAVRSTAVSLSPFNWQCRGEGHVFQGAINPVTPPICQCTLTGGPGTYVHASLNGLVQCGGLGIPFNSHPLSIIGLPGGFMMQMLGYWGVPGTPPTQELVICFGVLDYQEACPPAGFPFHVVTGVATHLPPVFVFGGGPVGLGGTWSMDLQDTLLLPTPTQPFLFPGFGSPSVSSLVWNLNLP
jgi:hypothetical protein